MPETTPAKFIWDQLRKIVSELEDRDLWSIDNAPGIECPHPGPPRGKELKPLYFMCCELDFCEDCHDTIVEYLIEKDELSGPGKTPIDLAEAMLRIRDRRGKRQCRQKILEDWQSIIDKAARAHRDDMLILESQRGKQ